MKIREVGFSRLDLKLAVPYTIAYETVSETSNVLLFLVTDTGLAGWGCAAPDSVVTGETVNEVLAVENIVRDMLLNRDPFHIARICQELKKVLPKHASTRAMVDMALHDLLARKAGLPLYQLLGGYRKAIATSITIGIVSQEETLERARKHLQDGFTILKLKGGLNVEEDVEKVLRLRERFGNEFQLRFDANQGYSIKQSLRFTKEVAAADVEIIEQPTRRGWDESLGQITQTANQPVMADESISTLSDAFRLAANEQIDMINIKLMKMGGIFESMHINSVAKAAGMEVMVGCLDESALGISAGLHFALSRANIEYADLDGHLDLVGDPFGGLFKLENGILTPCDAPGLGNVPYMRSFI